MKKNLLFVSVCLAIFLLSVACTACSKPAASPAPEKPRALTVTELEEYAVSKNIKIMATENTGDKTIIIGRQENEVRIYPLVRDETGKVLEGSSLSYEPASGDQNPVDLFTIGEGVDYVAVIINDLDLQTKAQKIVVRLSNGDELSEAVDDKMAYILINGAKTPDTEFASVTLYDGEGRNMYEDIKP